MLSVACYLIVGLADRRDPTRPTMRGTVGETVSEDSLRADNIDLSAILLSSGRRIAIISGQIVKEGESIAGMRLFKILPHSVILKNEESGEEITLLLSKQKIRIKKIKTTDNIQ